MGTAQVAFAEVVLPEVTWPEEALTGSDILTGIMFCASLGHIILIASQSVFLLFPLNAAYLAEKQQLPIL
jgi:short-subunit dehydrogenase